MKRSPIVWGFAVLWLLAFLAWPVSDSLASESSSMGQWSIGYGISFFAVVILAIVNAAWYLLQDRNFTIPWLGISALLAFMCGACAWVCMLLLHAVLQPMFG